MTAYKTHETLLFSCLTSIANYSWFLPKNRSVPLRHHWQLSVKKEESTFHHFPNNFYLYRLLSGMSERPQTEQFIILGHVSKMQHSKWPPYIPNAA